MGSFNEHCDECLLELGEAYPQVHRWLDEFFHKVGPKHRSIRHHQEGVEEVRRMWGNEAAEAARMHILRDWEWHPEFQEGVVPTRRQVELWTIDIC